MQGLAAPEGDEPGGTEATRAMIDLALGDYAGHEPDMQLLLLNVE